MGTFEYVTVKLQMSSDEGPEQEQPDSSFEWAVEAEGSGGRGGGIHCTNLNMCNICA